MWHPMKQGGRMGPMTPLYVAVSVLVGRLTYTFSSKPFRAVFMRETDQINVNSARPVTILPKGLENLDHFACVTIILLETQKEFV